MQDINLEHINNIGWLVDYPAHLFSRLNCNLQSSHVISSNPFHKHYVNEITNTNYGQALNIGVNDFDSNLPNLSNRDFDIVFVGSWMGTPDNFWDPIQNSKIRNLSKKALEILISDDKSDSYTVIKHLLIESNINPINSIVLLNALILLLEDFIRKYQRLKLMNAATMSGLKTLVVGTGWSDHFAGSNLFFHHPVSNEDMNQIYRKCKMVICLNSNNGACERALQALSNGCSVFSFDGIPMDDLKLKSNGIFTTSSFKSDYAIKKEMIDWYDNFIYDCNEQINVNKIFENYSWDKVSEKLLNFVINCEDS
jgi:glycosyltransferase involved in cell wall biosynthesis